MVVFAALSRVITARCIMKLENAGTTKRVAGPICGIGDRGFDAAVARDGDHSKQVDAWTLDRMRIRNFKNFLNFKIRAAAQNYITRWLSHLLLVGARSATVVHERVAPTSR